MVKKGVLSAIVLSLSLIVSGCASIPQESVTLSKEIGSGITSIHESNVRFVEQYFRVKKSEIDIYEKEAMDNFFNKIAAAAANPEAPPLGAQELYKIKGKVEEIHALGSKFKEELDISKSLVIEKLQNEYNTLISANSSITGLLQSAVDVDKAKNDGISKVKEYTNGKVDLTDIDEKVNEYLSKWGASSAQASGLVESIQGIINSKEEGK